MKNLLLLTLLAMNSALATPTENLNPPMPDTEGNTAYEKIKNAFDSGTVSNINAIPNCLTPEGKYANVKLRYNWAVYPDNDYNATWGFVYCKFVQTRKIKTEPNSCPPSPGTNITTRTFYSIPNGTSWDQDYFGIKSSESSSRLYKYVDQTYGNEHFLKTMTGSNILELRSYKDSYIAKYTDMNEYGEITVSYQYIWKMP